MEYYDESVLLALASAVGTPIKVDMKTVDAARGKYARVCVEISLEQTVVGRLWFRGHWFKVEYEGLHLLCSKCGLFGHLGRNCPGAGGGGKEAGVADQAGTEDDAKKQPVGDVHANPNGGVITFS